MIFGGFKFWDKAVESDTTDETDIEHSCFFTGHRPSKLPYGYDEADEKCRELKSLLRTFIARLINNKKVTRFYCGMAEGFDLWACETVLDLKKSCPSKLELIAAIPFEGQTNRWTSGYVKRYNAALKQCREVVNMKEITKGLTTGQLYHARNAYMVDRAFYGIALLDPVHNDSGTKATVKYALKQGRYFVIIDPNTNKFETYNNQFT